MNFSDKILEYIESQPKAVVIALLGIITGGAVGGGLMIRSLQNTIEYREKIISEYEQLNKKEITIQESTREAHIELYKQKNEILNEAISEFKKGISLYSSTSDKIINNLNSVLPKKGIESEDKNKIAKAIKIIRDQQDGIEKSINNAESLLKISSKIDKLQNKSIKNEVIKQSKDKK